MRKQTKYSKELKLEIIKRYLKGESSILLANEYRMPKSMQSEIRRWAHRYEALGESAFSLKNSNRSYSKEFKMAIINEYLAGGTSYELLSVKYNIPSNKVVRKWVSKYNNGIEIKDYDPKGDVYTMKSRKTTLEEKIEIVEYVLAHNNDYKSAADKYNVPYSNVYNWVKKYKECGKDRLFDYRGRPSSKEKCELSDLEKKDIEIEKLKRELERSKMIIEILKKNEEIKEKMEKDSHLLGKKANTKQ